MISEYSGYVSNLVSRVFPVSHCTFVYLINCVIQGLNNVLGANQGMSNIYLIYLMVALEQEYLLMFLHVLLKKISSCWTKVSSRSFHLTYLWRSRYMFLQRYVIRFLIFCNYIYLFCFVRSLRTKFETHARI